MFVRFRVDLCVQFFPSLKFIHRLMTFGHFFCSFIPVDCNAFSWIAFVDHLALTLNILWAREFEKVIIIQRPFATNKRHESFYYVLSYYSDNYHYWLQAVKRPGLQQH